MALMFLVPALLFPGGASGETTPEPGPFWISPIAKPEGTTLRYRAAVNLPSSPKPLYARIRILSPQRYRLFVNGEGITVRDTPINRAEEFHVILSVKPGENRIEIETPYDPNDASSNRVAFDFAAWDAKGDRIARRVSDATVDVDGGTSQTLHPLEKNLWAYQRLSLRGPDDQVSRPSRSEATVEFKDNSDRWAAGTSIAARVRISVLKKKNPARVSIVGENWMGKNVFDGEADIRWNGLDGEADLVIPPLPRGLYRFEAWLTDAEPPLALNRYTALAVLGPGEKRIRDIFDTLTPLPKRPFLQGVDIEYSDSASFLMSLRDLGVNFVDYHVGPNWGHFDNGAFDDFLQFVSATGMRFTLNNEEANWGFTWIDKTGVNRFNTPDGCHRWDLGPDILDRAAATGLFEGVVYDEPEHMQLCRNFYANCPDVEARPPYFVETTGMTLPEAYEATFKAMTGIVEYNRKHGAATLAESVFPVMFHPMARAGFTLCPKLLKEGVHPVILAMALGAAKQYGTKLWFSPDFWLLGEYPGHTVEQYREALQLAHRAGVDCVYTEQLMVLAPSAGPQYEISEYGRSLRGFIDGLAGSDPRSYTHRDYTPEVAIVRFPDSDWGQASCGYWNTLYGAKNLQSTPETREWLQLWSLLTRGGTDPRAVNANSQVYKPEEWRFSIASPSVAIYDHLAGYDALSSANAIFLCGFAVSPETLAAVGRRVGEGATCFTTPRLAPEPIRRKAGAGLPARVEEGKGSWILVEGFTEAQVGPYLDRIPAPPDSSVMRLRFAGAGAD